MRYVAKIHILDVLDQVVISGYVLDADDWTNPDHETTEFVYQWPGLGLSDPRAWLSSALVAMLEQSNGLPRLASGQAVADGGSNTISGIGRQEQPGVG